MNPIYELYYNQYNYVPWVVVKVEYYEAGETRTIVTSEETFEGALKYIKSWEQPNNSFGVKVL